MPSGALPKEEMPAGALPQAPKGFPGLSADILQNGLAYPRILPYNYAWPQEPEDTNAALCPKTHIFDRRRPEVKDH